MSGVGPGVVSTPLATLDSPVTIVIAIVVGLIAVRFLRLTLGHVLLSPVLERSNYRGARIPTAAGILIPLSLLLIDAGRTLYGALGVGNQNTDRAQSLMLVCVLGFGLLGLLDDVLGDAVGGGGDRGFRGHLRALAQGRITTGLLKLVGGAGVAVVLVAFPGFPDGRNLIVDALLVALAANLANLFDRAPGRTIKFACVAYVPLAFALGVSGPGVAVAPVIGAALGLLGDDLNEHLMLGDTGANALGAALGLGVVLGCDASTRLTVMLVLLALNVGSEVVSFSGVIDAVAPLRAFDRWGSRPERRHEPTPGTRSRSGTARRTGSAPSARRRQGRQREGRPRQGRQSGFE